MGQISQDRQVAQPIPRRTEKSFESGDDGLPSFTKILARAKHVIDLTLDNNQSVMATTIIYRGKLTELLKRLDMV